MTRALELGCWIHCPETKEYDEVYTLGLETECDVRIDLRTHSIPFPDNHFDFIWAHQVIEHFPDTIEILKECLRVLKPDGKIEIHVPHYLHACAWGNLTHYRAFYRTSFACIDVKSVREEDYGVKIRHTVKYLWFNHTVPKEGRLIAKIIDGFMTWFINRFPKLYDGHLIFLLGAPEEIVYIVEKIKEDGKDKEQY